MVNFRTSFVKNSTGEEITGTKQIAIQYVKGRFWIDLVSSIPLDTFSYFIYNDVSNSTMLQLIGLLKLVRVLRLSRLITYMNLK